MSRFSRSEPYRRRSRSPIARRVPPTHLPIRTTSLSSYRCLSVQCRWSGKQTSLIAHLEEEHGIQKMTMTKTTKSMSACLYHNSLTAVVLVDNNHCLFKCSNMRSFWPYCSALIIEYKHATAKLEDNRALVKKRVQNFLVLFMRPNSRYHNMHQHYFGTIYVLDNNADVGDFWYRCVFFAACCD